MQLAADGWDTVFRGGSGDPPGCGPQDKSAWCGLMPPPEQQLGRRAYYANVAFIDEWVGNIMAALDGTGALERTFIIWTADHGDGQADHFHWRKGFPYQFSANVPFLLRWPASHRGATIPRGTVSPLVVELRDVFPTLLDAAGGMGTVPPGHKVDGTSLLCLLGDASGAGCSHAVPGNSTAPRQGWRPWLDLEHSTCYNATNHWSALTDGRMKYIFNACPDCTFPPREQLFNLTADPGERHGLHADPKYAAELSKWRGRMVAQFEAEGRGPQWVADGKLLTRQSETYGPNYPSHSKHKVQSEPRPQRRGARLTAAPQAAQCTKTAVAAGDRLVLDPNQSGSGGTRICQDLTVTAHQQLALDVAPTLCVEPTAGSGLELAACTAAAQTSPQAWKVPKMDAKAQWVIHSATGLCLTGTSAGSVGLSKCAEEQSLEPGANMQLWVYGASGRLCSSSGCLSVPPK